jgi:YD repeat-containing protein
VQAVPKSGSGLSTLTASAVYPTSCFENAACNKPTSTTDARGNTTDYDYDTTTGQLLSVTAAAPTTGATRPQTRYSYAIDNDGVYELSTVSQCQTGSSCAGTSDEVKQTVATDDNGNVVSTTIAAGDNSLSATTAGTYDAMGNLLTVDGPLSGSADTIRYRYNAARQLIGTAGPDPDGTGSLKNRAVRNTYTNGLLTKEEIGTVNSQSDTDWAAFSALQAVDMTYDANARPVTAKLSAGSTTYALTQTSYDALGRTDCAAVRMNPSVYGSLPSSACTLGTQGSDGPDRITKATYDAAGRVTTTTSGYGTAEQRDDAIRSFTSNGQVATLTDGESNKTSFVYDGFDRLSQTFYPSTTKGAGTSSTTDYEQNTYDAAGNVTAFRNRAGQTISFTYDALNRQTYKDLPGTEPDVTYTYDLLNRLTGASESGNALSFTYDALGRQLTQTGAQGTITSAYDIAGRRTRITHPDSFYVDQDYLVTGEMTKVRENGATSGVGVLATYAYDDMGQRTSVTYGNGTSQSYSFDAVSRLSALTPSSGTGLPTATFGYNAASQINSRSRSNAALEPSISAGTRTETPNGLNQLTAIDSTSLSYDSNGNLTSDGTKTYGYSSENLLTSATGSVALSYDPAMRLYQVSSNGAATRRLQYDGADLVAEYDTSGNRTARYVHGPGADEPIVQYDSAGTRRFLHKDERGQHRGAQRQLRDRRQHQQLRGVRNPRLIERGPVPVYRPSMGAGARPLLLQGAVL